MFLLCSATVLFKYQDGIIIVVLESKHFNSLSATDVIKYKSQDI